LRCGKGVDINHLWQLLGVPRIEGSAMYHFKIILLSTALATALGGCTPSAMKFRPTMGADPSEIGFEAQALVNEMRQAYDEDLPCTPIAPSFQNTAKESYQRLGTSPENKVKSFACVRFKNPNNPVLPPQRYYAAGLALSDIYCDDYFRRIAEHKQKRQFGRSTTNDVGTAASAGLGLASAGSILTGGIGAAFGLADNLFRNYDNAFVVEPNLGKMLKLIKTAQSTLKSSTQPDSFTNYFEAHRAVSEYAQLCSYVGMDALLDRAIESGTVAITREAKAAAASEANPPAKPAADNPPQP
jgi:hypothetical protein